MTKRKAQAAASRQKLIDAARILISQKDYDQLTILDITNACGMSTGNFYHYFKSKEDIFLAIEREPFDEFIASMHTHPDETTEEQLTGYLQNYVYLSEKVYGPNLNRQWFRYHVGDAVADPPRPNKMDLTRDEMVSILKRGVVRGELTEDAPIEDMALQLSFLLHGISLYNVMTNGKFDSRTWMREHKKIVSSLLEPYLKNE